MEFDALCLEKGRSRWSFEVPGGKDAARGRCRFGVVEVVSTATGVA